MHKREKYEWNSFTGKIILMVLVGIVLIAVTVTTVVLSMSQNVFMETYGKSQEQVFVQIEQELNDLHVDLQELTESIDSSWAFRLYLNNNSALNNVQNFQNIYQMEKDLEESEIRNMDRVNILVLGMHGSHYLSRTETISMQDEEILASDPVKLAFKEPESMHYIYSKGAYTATTKNSDVIIATKALYFKDSREVYGVVLITLTMEDMQKYFNYFVSENTAWYLVNDEDIVICSNKRELVGKTIQQDWYKQAKNSDADRYSVQSDGRYLTVMKASCIL